jgi:hypothetical protein
MKYQEGYKEGREDFEAGLRPRYAFQNYLIGWMDAEYDAKHDTENDKSDESQIIV